MGRKYFFAGLILLSSFLFNGCKKPDGIGLNVLPSEDLFYTVFSDTASITTTTTREDSLRADELSRILFGSIKDDSVGLTNSSYFGQILLSSTPNLISDSTHSRVADSLVLSLAYTGWYGDTSISQKIHVYRMTEDMNVDSNYYSDRLFALDGANDLEKTQSPYLILPTSNVVVDTTSVSPQLRVELNDAIRDEIFGLNGHVEFTSNDYWKSYFKGLYIEVNPATNGGGAILYFDPNSAYTRMTLYYHEDTIAKSYSFTLTGGARVNHIDHDFTGSSANVQLMNPNQQFTFNYLQPLAGLKTKISFPYLKHFVDSGSILVNKAELVVTVPSGSSTTTNPVPDNILLLAKNDTGGYQFPIDYYERNYGGAFSITSNTYTFGITRTIQRILDGTTADYCYTLNILGSMVEANTARIGGGVGSDSRMKLKLYYTKLH